MIELERTFLLAKLPDNLESCEKKELIDVYIPPSDAHPILRIRKNGNKYEITKKCPIHEGDASTQKEETIHLTEEEFKPLSQVQGKRVRKIRYFYPWNGHTAEIDIFQDDLKGLAVVDFEFSSKEEKDSFTPPDLCGSDVTQEKFIAGGMICGKKYEDVQADLKRFDYTKLE